MRSTRLALSVLAALAAAACSSEDSTTRHIAAYDTLDSCTAFQDEDSCLANADRCVWYALGRPCVEGEPCISGVCQDIDPCRVHTDVDSCGADEGNRCAWASVELCPGENCGDGGFCYQMTDDQDCTCVCPLGPCAEGEDCPPCECDCPDDDGGNTCTCTGTVCPDGDPDCVPTMDCTCDDDGGGGAGCGTCTCSGTVCPDSDPNCVPEPPVCDCEDGGGETCVCPECPPGETCPPCECAVASGGARVPTYEGDPCLAYADEATCAADAQCAWLQNPCPLCPDCAPGTDCGSTCECDETFSCRYVGDSDCTCVCPDCAPGETCPPCECTCGGGGGGCAEPGSGGGSTGGSSGG